MMENVPQTEFDSFTRTKNPAERAYVLGEK